MMMVVVDENPVDRNHIDVTDRHSGRAILITLPTTGFPVEMLELINSIHHLRGTKCVI